MLSVTFWLQRWCEGTYGQVLCVTVVNFVLQMTGSDILNFGNALQAGSIITPAALTGRELVDAANLTAACALELDLLIGLRHDRTGRRRCAEQV